MQLVDRLKIFMLVGGMPEAAALTPAGSCIAGAGKKRKAARRSII